MVRWFNCSGYSMSRVKNVISIVKLPLKQFLSVGKAVKQPSLIAELNSGQFLILYQRLKVELITCSVPVQPQIIKHFKIVKN